MEMTITEYCKRYFTDNKYQRIYINRLIKGAKDRLLADTYGIIYYRMVGPIYVVTVKADFKPNSINTTLTK
jgi:hypothetical protein